MYKKNNGKTIKMYKKNLTCKRTPSYVMRKNFFTKGKVMSYFLLKKVLMLCAKFLS